MRFALRAALLAAALLGFASPHAQAQGDVSPAECAAAAVGTALTVYPDVPLYSAVSGMETVGAPLRFRTRVAILPGPRKGVRIPVREADGARCGYVDGTKILSGQPLNVIDIDPDQQVRVSIFGVVRDKRHVRAMLRSNPKLDATAHEAQLFDAPGGRPFKRSRVFGLFNVFKVEKIGTDPDDWWYFIGGRKVTDATAVSGWVRGGNLFLWRGNLAAYSVPDNTAPFDIYTDIQSLMQGSKAGLIATRADLEPPADRDIFKFPILDQIFKDEAARKAGAPPIAYEIGFFGQGCGAAGECADAVKISDQLSKIGEIVRSSGQIDVVLVVENTEGMTKYLVPIARAVSGWARETSAKRQEGRVRFGAAIYGDYRDPRRPAIDNMDFRMIATLDLDASKLERALTGVGTPFGDAVGDRPGAGYAALVRAAREAFWAADAGYRLVIWIGSQGVQRDTAKLIDPVDVAQVQREVGEKKIFLAAISVAGSRPGKSTFIEDASRILDRSKMALGVPPIRSFDGATPPPREEPEMAAEKVKQLLDAVLYFSRSVPEWIESQRGKETPAKAGETASLAPEAGGLPIAKLVDVSALKAGPFARLGLTSGEVERVLNLKQMTTKGYVGYDTQKKNLAFLAAVEPDRFNLLQGSVAELCRAVSEDDDLRNRMLGLMLALAQALGAAPYHPAETLSEYFDSLRAFQPQYLKTWLNQPIADFAKEWAAATAERKAQLQLSACRSAYLLQHVGAGLKVESMDDLELDATIGKVRLKPGRSLRPFNWLWSTESRIEFYFVPLDYLPQG